MPRQKYIYLGQPHMACEPQVKSAAEERGSDAAQSEERATDGGEGAAKRPRTAFRGAFVDMEVRAMRACSVRMRWLRRIQTRHEA